MRFAAFCLPSLGVLPAGVLQPLLLALADGWQRGGAVRQEPPAFIVELANFNIQANLWVGLVCCYVSARFNVLA